MTKLQWAIAIVLGAVIAFAIPLPERTPAPPGIAVTRSFIDGGEEYSADGCWKIIQGYWRPLRRCNVVRLQYDPKLDQ